VVCSLRYTNMMLEEPHICCTQSDELRRVAPHPIPDPNSSRLMLQNITTFCCSLFVRLDEPHILSKSVHNRQGEHEARRASLSQRQYVTDRERPSPFLSPAISRKTAQNLCGSKNRTFSPPVTYLSQFTIYK